MEQQTVTGKSGRVYKRERNSISVYQQTLSGKIFLTAFLLKDDIDAKTLMMDLSSDSI